MPGSSALAMRPGRQRVVLVEPAQQSAADVGVGADPVAIRGSAGRLSMVRGEPRAARCSRVLIGSSAGLLGARAGSTPRSMSSGSLCTWMISVGADLDADRPAPDVGARYRARSTETTCSTPSTPCTRPMTSLACRLWPKVHGRGGTGRDGRRRCSRPTARRGSRGGRARPRCRGARRRPRGCPAARSAARESPDPRRSVALPRGARPRGGGARSSRTSLPTGSMTTRTVRQLPVQA